IIHGPPKSLPLARFPEFRSLVIGMLTRTWPHPLHFALTAAWTMSAILAAMGLMVRAPLGGPGVFPFAKAFLLLGAVVSAQMWALLRLEERGGSCARVWASMLAVLTLPCVAFPIGPLANVVIYPILVGLFAVGGILIVAAARHMRPAQVLAPIGFGIVIGFGYFLFVNAATFASVLVPEEAIVGTSNMDLLFHTSIANMLVNHGALSIGL